MPGSPLPFQSSSREIEQGLDAISSFHASVGSIHRATARPPAVLTRLQRCDTIINSNLILQIDKAANTKECKPRHAALANRTIELWNSHHQPIRQLLYEASATPVPLQWVLRDCHREHVLFTDDNGDLRTSGIIDFDAARIDTVATDLARYLGSFDLNQSTSSVMDMLAASLANRPLSEKERVLVPLLIRSTCLIAAVNWGQWLCVDGQRFPGDQEKPTNRFEEVVKQAEMLF